MKRAILAVDGVQALYLLRSRRMGHDALVDVHILVDPKVSVSEGHQISESVRTRLMRRFDEISDVLVHIDPEADEATMSSRDLPLREEILDRLHRQWRGLDEARRIEHVTLHYLEGRVDVEVVLPLDVVADLPAAQALARTLARRAKSLGGVGEIRVHFEGASE